MGACKQFLGGTVGREQDSGLIHTMLDKFENATLRAKNGTNVLRPHMKMDKMFCIHTRAFLGGCLLSKFGSLSISRYFLGILKFSRHSSGTTTSFTKLSHHALVLPVESRTRLFKEGINLSLG